ncbi:phosphotransferase family protein [Hamadaea tsunoensis]|uniref:phosphotransferase family protein n=1 Tax=Hamadaea tsunoensis TaxID=53368 RepID=UPI000484A064|nr:aminoglycoside phosphotransferase family protein [Hamadaea tsunoensis]
MSDPSSDRRTTVTAILAAAGFHGPHAPLALFDRGHDNHVYATRCDGIDLLVKTPRTSQVRYSTAAWAATRLAVAGVPGPRVIGYSDQLLIETRCPGTALANHLLNPATVEQVGALLRRLHTVTVTGFGQLDATGTGRHATAEQWLMRLPDLGTTANREQHQLHAAALRAIREHLPLLAGEPARLLHGDLTASHIIVDTPHRPGELRVTGFVDLESARGGDPLADLAGWSLNEPAAHIRPLLDGYFAEPPTAAHLLRLVLYRIRISMATLARHLAEHEQPAADLRTAQLRADLDDLHSGNLHLVPRITAPLKEGHPCS